MAGRQHIVNVLQVLQSSVDCKWKGEALPQPNLRRQAAARPGGLQDALKRHPLRSVGFREDRSPRVNDPGAVQGLLRARVHPQSEH